MAAINFPTAPDIDDEYTDGNGVVWVCTMDTATDGTVAWERKGIDAGALLSSDLGVTVQAYDADTAKLDVVQTFTAAQTLNEVVLGETTDTVYSLTGTAIDPANGNVQYKTLSTNTTFTDSSTTGQTVLLRLAAGDSYTVTWPTMTWCTSAGNVAPTLTASDAVVLWKEGSTLYGAYLGSMV